MHRLAWLLWFGLIAGCAGTPEDDGASSSSAPAPAPAGSDTPPGGAAPTSAPKASAPVQGPNRGRYAALPDMGEARAYFRAHGQRTLVDRGYFRGDLQLTGAGLTKEGAGPGESVIDGDVTIRGDGWTLRDLTITGNVELLGDRNDISGCEVAGRVISPALTNRLPPGK